MADGAPVVHPELGTNVFDFPAADPELDAILAGAAAT